MYKIIIFIILNVISLLSFSQELKYYDAFVALDMEKQQGFPVTDLEYKRLNSIYSYMDSVISFSNEINEEKALNICIAMSNALESRFGITFENTALLSEGLKKNKLDCNYYSILFYTYLKKHSQKPELIITPGHMFLRWYYNENSYLNYETTAKIAITDEQYINEFRISATAIKNNLYLKPLTVPQLVACGYMEMSTTYTETQTQKQRVLLNKTLKLFPNLVMAMGNLAYCAVLEKKTDEAITILNKAIALDTLNYVTYQQAGRIYQKASRYKEALKYYSKGIARNPKDPQSYIYRSNCYLDMKNVEAAMTDFDNGSALLKTDDIFKFLFDYLSLQLLENRIMEEYLKVNDK